MVTPIPIKPAEVKEKTKTFLNKFTEFMARFLGSWWAIIVHTAWFSIWMILDFDVNLLTFGVSLEAIFIGIFLLMAANKAEIQRDIKEEFERERDRRKLDRDIKLDEKAERQLAEIKRFQKEMQVELLDIKKSLKKLESSK